MDKRTIEEMIKYLKFLLNEKGIEVDKIILFGSSVKNDLNKANDIDIAIVSKSFSGKGIFERAKIFGDTEWKLLDKYLFPLDIVTMAPEELEKGVSLVSQFVQEGEVIYER